MLLGVGDDERWERLVARAIGAAAAAIGASKADCVAAFTMPDSASPSLAWKRLTQAAVAGPNSESIEVAKP